MISWHVQRAFRSIIKDYLPHAHQELFAPIGWDSEVRCLYAWRFDLAMVADHP